MEKVHGINLRRKMNSYEYNYTVKKITDKQDYKVDVPVLILFFNRPAVLQQVFESVKKAKPSTLLLYQDGAREGVKTDAESIEACRAIFSRIDWNCTVYEMYQTKNYGCDPSGYMSRQWAFSIVDKCIILEDDTVPAVSFFAFCKELLDKYEDDKRIYRICGYNTLVKYSPYNSDYFFTKGGSIWGWATWKRVFDEWDTEYSFLNDQSVIDTYTYTYKNAAVPPKSFLKTCKWHRESQKEYFESIYSSCRYMGTGLSIVASKNMISNIGLTAGSTHATANLKRIPRKTLALFFTDTYEITGEMKHPKYVLEDKKYEDLQSKKMGWRRNVFQKAVDLVSRAWKRMLYGKR